MAQMRKYWSYISLCEYQWIWTTTTTKSGCEYEYEWVNECTERDCMKLGLKFNLIFTKWPCIFPLVCWNSGTTSKELCEKTVDMRTTNLWNDLSSKSLFLQCNAIFVFGLTESTWARTILLPFLPAERERARVCWHCIFSKRRWREEVNRRIEWASEREREKERE